MAGNVGDGDISTPTDTGQSSSDVLPGWLSDLKGIATADGGPLGWVRRRITEYLVGLVIGVFATTSHAVQSAWGTVADAFAMAGTATFAPLGDLGVTLLDLVDGGREFAVGMIAMLGPFGVVVVLVTLVVVAAVLWRAGVSLLESIPVVGGVVRFVR